MLAAFASWTFHDLLMVGLSALLGLFVYLSVIQGCRLWSDRRWMRRTFHD